MRRRFVRLSILLVAVSLLTPPLTTPAESLTLSLSATPSSAVSGQAVSVSLSATNSGGPSSVDLYFGLLNPSGTLTLFTSAGTQTASLSTLSAWTPIATRVSLASPFTVGPVSIFSLTLGDSDPAGTYIWFLAVLTPGALADNAVEASEVVALGTATFTLSSISSTSLVFQATNYTGPYPDPALVAFTTRAGAVVQTLAFPEQVQVFFTPSTSADAAKQTLAALGATVLAQIPKIGYYLAGVSRGGEATFISRVRQDSAVLEALPNGFLMDEADPVFLDVGALDRPVPLNVPAGGGAIVIDANFNTALGHGALVDRTITTNGGTVGAQVSTQVLTVGGRRLDPMDRIQAAIIASAEGSRIFNPGNPVLLNLSRGPATPANCPGCRAYDQRWEEFMENNVLRPISQLPDDVRRNVVLTKSLGNVSVDLTARVANLRARFPEVLDSNLLLVEATDPRAGSNRANDRAVVRVPGCITAADGSVHCGTSFAGPHVLAFGERALGDPALSGLTPSELVAAMRNAQLSLGSGDLTFAAVRQSGQVVLAPPAGVSVAATCCIQSGGCPGETGTSCASTCCCCPEGQRCCPDVTRGCCAAGISDRWDPARFRRALWSPEHGHLLRRVQECNGPIAARGIAGSITPPPSPMSRAGAS
ncbi:MAG: hypothetical protein HY726_23055 [Candidatus Rokubacteria bacterium]|nr:hypothetical protein [Candidatus Rokubacteria bacterium]